MIAFLSRTKRTLLCKWIEAPRYVPAGNVTSPPPSALHFAIARLIAAVSLSLPFPVAPKSRTLNVAELNWGTGKFGRVGDFAEHAVDRFQTFSRHFVDRAFGLEITLRRDKDWHGKKDQNVRA